MNAMQYLYLISLEEEEGKEEKKQGTINDAFSVPIVCSNNNKQCNCCMFSFSMNNQKVPSKIKVRDDNNERVTSWQMGFVC